MYSMDCTVCLSSKVSVFQKLVCYIVLLEMCELVECIYIQDTDFKLERLKKGYGHQRLSCKKSPSGFP